MTKRLISALVTLFLLTTTAFAQAAQPSAARDFLLSPEFFSEFYSSDSVDIVTFDAKNETLALPFKTNETVSRSVLDQKVELDCSRFDAYELILDVDDPAAIGYTTFYLHSKNGWYHSSSATKRTLIDGRIVYVYDAKDFGKEDSPVGYDQIDMIRVAVWRGQNVDATIRFHSLRAARLTYAIVDVDDDGGENAGINNTFGRMLDRCGIKAERVDDSHATLEALKRFDAVFLPIAGKIKPETTDAICDYIDAGGFVFAFYNTPEKLLKKLGVEHTGFVSCSRAGIELGGMKFDEEDIAVAKKNGFALPKFIEQQSWNYYRVNVAPDFKSERKLPLFGDSKPRVIANWTLADGGDTNDPAIVVGPNGLYCSHIFMADDFESKRVLLEAMIVSAAPALAKNMARGIWLSIFEIGFEPGNDTVKSYQKTLEYLEKALSKRGWTLEDAAKLMSADKGDVDGKAVMKFKNDIAEIKSERVDSYCSTRRSRVNEGRLWWEHSGCGIYPGDWDRTMKELSEAGFNCVIPNMLWGGNAYYKSDVLPIDPKVEKYGDQIEQAVAAGKKYGVEVHAWMVCFNASNSPKWFIDKMREEGRLQKTLAGEEKPWLCPSHPENRALQLAALEEVATKYDIDGVHFDYIRFPDDLTCYCDGCKERFAHDYHEKTGKDIGEFPQCVRQSGEVKTAFEQWRCDQITALVRAVHDSLKAKRPEIKTSAAVFSGYPGTKRSIGQDWGLWIDEGLLDFVCPMDYTSDPATFANYVKNQLPYTQGKVPLYPGIGMTATGIAMDAHDVVLQAEIAKKLGAEGFTIFNLTKSTADKALPAFKKGVNSTPTKAPHQN